MTSQLEFWITAFWNWLVRRIISHRQKDDLLLGHEIEDGKRTGRRLSLSTKERTQNVAVTGRSGSGKTSLLRYLCEQDISANRGFVFFDLHGDTTPEIVKAIAEEELRRGEDLSNKLVVVEPADPAYAVGLNVLEAGQSLQLFVEISEIVEILKSRWKLETFGARTEELLRSSLVVLAQAKLTLLDVIPLLTDTAFRAEVLAVAGESESYRFFRDRYDLLSKAMQSVYREAVLNKVSLFAADPHFRHVLGQRNSTISFADVLEEGKWLLINLDKGRLGEEALTLGGLLLSRLKHQIFARRSRCLFSLYCDELQNLLAYDVGVETLFAESRKKAVSIVSANQFLEQTLPRVRAAIFATGTQVFFQLSARDASYVAHIYGEGQRFAESLRALPRREAAVALSSGELMRVRIPRLPLRSLAFSNLYTRCQQRWARLRTDVEGEIAHRKRSTADARKEELEGWR